MGKHLSIMNLHDYFEVNIFNMFRGNKFLTHRFRRRAVSSCALNCVKAGRWQTLPKIEPIITRGKSPPSYNELASDRILYQKIRVGMPQTSFVFLCKVSTLFTLPVSYTEIWNPIIFCFAPIRATFLTLGSLILGWVRSRRRQILTSWRTVGLLGCVLCQMLYLIENINPDL